MALEELQGAGEQATSCRAAPRDVDTPLLDTPLGHAPRTRPSWTRPLLGLQPPGLAPLGHAPFGTPPPGHAPSWACPRHHSGQECGVLAIFKSSGGSKCTDPSTHRAEALERCSWPGPTPTEEGSAAFLGHPVGFRAQEVWVALLLGHLSRSWTSREDPCGTALTNNCSETGKGQAVTTEEKELGGRHPEGRPLGRGGPNSPSTGRLAVRRKGPKVHSRGETPAPGAQLWTLLWRDPPF